jgi:hypothetical protein
MVGSATLPCSIPISHQSLGQPLLIPQEYDQPLHSQNWRAHLHPAEKEGHFWFTYKVPSDGLWSRNSPPPRPQVEGVSRPKTIMSVFLLPQKSHECGFIFILCHKNYWKTTFNYGIPHAKFAMTLHRRSHDITSTCPTIRMTSQRKSVLYGMLYLIFSYHARIPRSITGLNGSNFFIVILLNILSWW